MVENKSVSVFNLAWSLVSLTTVVAGAMGGSDEKSPKLPLTAYS